MTGTPGRGDAAGADDASRLIAAASTEDRLALLVAAGPITEDRLTALLDQAEERVHNHPSAAEALALLVDSASDSMSAAVSEAVPDAPSPPADDGPWPAARARARYQRARILADRGELAPALALIYQARELWQRSGEQLSALRTDLGRMQILMDLGRHQETITVARELIVAVERCPDGPTALRRQIHAHAMDNLGVAYGFTGDHALAMQAYAAARETYLELGLDEVAARPLANRAVELLALGRPREALDDLRAAEEVFLAADDQLFAAQCLGDLASAHRQLGEFSEALSVLEEARRRLDDLGAHAQADRVRLVVAETYLDLSLIPEARAAAAECAERTANAGMPHDHALAQLLLGLSYLASADAVPAGEHLNRALAAFEQVADRQHEARTQLALAEVAALTGSNAEAMAAAGRAAVALEAGGWLPALTWSYLRRLDWTDDRVLTWELLSRASELVDQLGLPNLSFAYGLRRARWLRRRGDRARAETTLRHVVDELDQASAALTDYVVRTAFRTDRSAAYDELVDLLCERGDVEQAATVSDESKARTLMELRERAVGPGPRLAGGARELADAYADLNATYAALHIAADAPTRLLMRERADLLEREVGSLRLRHAAHDRPRAARPTARAGAGAAVGALAFHIVGEDILAFIGRPGSITVHRSTRATPRLTQLLDALSAHWSRRSRPHRSPHQDALLHAATQRTLGELYDLILRPLGADLDALQAAEPELRIIPHGQLGSVPFRALFDGERYLLERGTINVTPTRGAPVETALAGRAGVVVSVADDAIPAATQEAKLVADLLVRGGHPVTELGSGDATTDAVTAAMAGAGVVHLACHAIFRRENPLFSRLRLADRWLTTTEIVQLDLPGALVTISACDSGMSEAGTEPIGLAWAFLAAGAAGVVVSQWAVDDETARELMGHFYRELKAGAQPATALRSAQLRIAAERPHPYYWAPFTYLNSTAGHADS